MLKTLLGVACYLVLYNSYIVSPHAIKNIYAKQTESPWFALIIDKHANDPSKNRCGGSLLSNRYIVTAAHCLTNVFDEFGRIKGAKKLEIKLGEWKIESDPDCDYEAEEEEICDSYAVIPAQEIIMPKNRTANDIALIKLQKNVRFTDLISSISLPDSSMCSKNSLDEKWTVTGFGFDNPTSYAKMKKKIIIDLKSKEDCNFTKPYSNNYICGKNSGGSFPTCPGDSGSGAVSFIGGKPYLHGIVSAGTNTCNPQIFSTIFAKVACYTDWIREQIGEKIASTTAASKATVTDEDEFPEDDEVDKKRDEKNN